MQRDPWRTVWRFVTSDLFLASLLIALAVVFLLSVWLPQTVASDPVSYSQQIARARSWFGEATDLLDQLGLFSLHHSLLFRALLGLLGGSLLLRLIDLVLSLLADQELIHPGDDWQAVEGLELAAAQVELADRPYRLLSVEGMLQADRHPWAPLFRLLAHLGALLILVGLLLSHLWGWDHRLTIVAGDREALPGAGRWVALNETTGELSHSPGVRILKEERGPGVAVQAYDDQGRSLDLIRSLTAQPQPSLRVAVSEDQFLALPDADLIVRLALEVPVSPRPQSPLLVQVYRSPPGELLRETYLTGDTATVAVEGADLEFSRLPYSRVTASFNPGLWPAVVGVSGLAMGLLAAMIWPPRRFWLRERRGIVERVGRLPVGPIWQGEAETEAED